jgi:hypothetical protein
MAVGRPMGKFSLCIDSMPPRDFTRGPMLFYFQRTSRIWLLPVTAGNEMEIPPTHMPDTATTIFDLEGDGNV